MASEETAEQLELRRREQYIASLHELAEFMRTHPAIPAPYYTTVNVFLDSREQVAAVARSSSWEKNYTGSLFMLRKRFSEHLILDVNIGRESVCRKVVTGTRVVAAQPAQPEREEEIEEWICDEASLLAGG